MVHTCASCGLLDVFSKKITTTYKLLLSRRISGYDLIKSKGGGLYATVQALTNELLTDITR